MKPFSSLQKLQTAAHFMFNVTQRFLTQTPPSPAEASSAEAEQQPDSPQLLGAARAQIVPEPHLVLFQDEELSRFSFYSSTSLSHFFSNFLTPPSSLLLEVIQHSEERGVVVAEGEKQRRECRGEKVIFLFCGLFPRRAELK